MVTRGVGLRFESLLFSKEKNNYLSILVTSGVMVNTSGVESEALGSNPNDGEIMMGNL